MISVLVDKISAALVAELARLGWPPLADNPDKSAGCILLGETHQFGQHVPPRVIFRPTKSDFSSKDTTLGWNPQASSAPGKYTEEGRAAISNPAFLSSPLSFDVRCWGICPVDEPIEPRAGDLDYDFTHGLYTTLLAALHRIYPNSFEVGPGQWLMSGHVPREGQEFVFSLTIGTPVLKLGRTPPAVNGWTPGEPARNSPKAPPAPPGGVQPGGMPFVPPGTRALIEDSMVDPTGASEPGCEDDE